MIVARSVARTACHVSAKRKLLALRSSSCSSSSTSTISAAPAARTTGRKRRSVTTTRLPALANWCATCSGVEVL